jgi:hypothetical protein
VVKQLADAHHLFSVLVADEGDEGVASRSDWVLLSDREARPGAALQRPHRWSRRAKISGSDG